MRKFDAPSADPGDIVAMDSDKAVFLSDGANIIRLDGRGSFESILQESPGGISDVAVADDDVLMILHGAALGAFFGGRVMPVFDLPASGRRMSCYERQAYLVLEDSGQGSLLYRYDAAAKRLVPLMRADKRINAICGVRGGCIIAVGDSLYKLFDEPSGVASGKYHLVFLCAVSNAEITSVAAHQSSQSVLFADKDSTYVWSKGQVWSFFPLGGAICLRGDTLAISSGETGQVLRISSVSGRISEATEGLKEIKAAE
jgi:hypothetical protein